MFPRLRKAGVILPVLFAIGAMICADGTAARPAPMSAEDHAAALAFIAETAESMAAAETALDGAGTRDGAAAILYDVTPRAGHGPSLGLRIEAGGSVHRFAVPERHALPRTLWRVARATQSETPPRVVETLEDTPFYARALVAATLLGRPVTAMHESLALDRFARTWVRLLLPFRMPRTLR